MALWIGNSANLGIDTEQRKYGLQFRTGRRVAPPLAQVLYEFAVGLCIGDHGGYRRHQSRGDHVAKSNENFRCM